jgi:diketogulonate reductase-like aldo/keto reductase
MPIRTTRLPSGELIPVLGQGTWRLGDSRARRRKEIAALQLGIDLGMTVIDTAEMYGDGAAEALVGEAIAGRRDEVFLVSKVLPAHASRRNVIRACERSLRFLNTDRLDLYLLHWRGRVPLTETCAAFAELARAGKIRYWGVSNFDLADMKELFRLRRGKQAATNQVLYNPARRGIEFDLLPWCRERRLPIMAYSPIDQGGLSRHRVLAKIGKRRGAAPAQVALAWVLRHDGVVAIPRARNAAHVRANRAALDLRLTQEDLAALDAAFPPPTRAGALEMV